MTEASLVFELGEGFMEFLETNFRTSKHTTVKVCETLHHTTHICYLVTIVRETEGFHSHAGLFLLVLALVTIYKGHVERAA
jgi:hypothetical protein